MFKLQSLFESCPYQGSLSYSLSIPINDPDKDCKLLAIGPEGGWSEYELDQMAAQGFDFFSMGDRILRVETAVTAVCACVAMLQSMTK